MITKLCFRDSRHHLQESLDVTVAVTPRRPELPDALAELAEQARRSLGDRTGWDWAGTWDGYCVDWNEMLRHVPVQSPAD